MTSGQPEQTLWHHADVLGAAQAQRSGDLGPLAVGRVGGLVLTDRREGSNLTGAAAVEVRVNPDDLGPGRTFPDGEVGHKLEIPERARLVSVAQPWDLAEPGRRIEAYNDPTAEKGTLYNFVGATHPMTLRDREDPFVEMRAALWQKNPQADTFDFEHIKALHGHLFQDVYPWAGDPRVGGMNRNDDRDNPFALPEEFEPSWAEISQVIEDADRWQGAAREDVVRDFPAVFTAANVVHAFREGNGRTQREFMQQLANQAGYRLDWTQMTRSENDLASHAARAGDLAPLRQVYDRVAAPIHSTEGRGGDAAVRRARAAFPPRGATRAAGQPAERPRDSRYGPTRPKGHGHER